MRSPLAPGSLLSCPEIPIISPSYCLAKTFRSVVDCNQWFHQAAWSSCICASLCNKRQHTQRRFLHRQTLQSPSHMAPVPCEITALSTVAAIKHTSHHSPYSPNTKDAFWLTASHVYRLSKSCSRVNLTSPRGTTFLITASRFHTAVQHLACSPNVPSDFASCSAPNCEEPTFSYALSYITVKNLLFIRYRLLTLQGTKNVLPFHPDLHDRPLKWMIQT